MFIIFIVISRDWEGIKLSIPHIKSYTHGVQNRGFVSCQKNSFNKKHTWSKALLFSSVANWRNKTFDFTVHTVWNTACLTGQSQSSYQLRYEILFIGVRWRLPSTKEAEESTKKIAMAKEGQLLLHTCRLLTHAVHKNYPELFLFFFCSEMNPAETWKKRIATTWKPGTYRNS